MGTMSFFPGKGPIMYIFIASVRCHQHKSDLHGIIKQPDGVVKRIHKHVIPTVSTFSIFSVNHYD